MHTQTRFDPRNDGCWHLIGVVALARASPSPLLVGADGNTGSADVSCLTLVRRGLSSALDSLVNDTYEVGDIMYSLECCI